MKLWGGAVEADVPVNMLDASDFRPVPDEQEVFVGTCESASIALIVDLCEPVKSKSLIDALAVHAEEAHRMAGSREFNDPIQTFTDTAGPYTVAGRVDISADAKLGIIYALFQLPKHQADVVVTYTVDMTEANGPEVNDELTSTGMDVVMNFISSFVVKDASLFKNH